MSQINEGGTDFENQDNDHLTKDSTKKKYFKVKGLQHWQMMGSGT